MNTRSLWKYLALLAIQALMFTSLLWRQHSLYALVGGLILAVVFAGQVGRMVLAWTRGDKDRLRLLAEGQEIIYTPRSYLIGVGIWTVVGVAFAYYVAFVKH